jgi:ubiquinone/menaquinone biosynthesis C-methylase UbiE
VPWLKKSTGDPLAVSMSGLKLGDRLLVVGSSDPLLTAALASKVGLTGRACLVDASEAKLTAAAAAVEQQGALVESFTAASTALPFDPEAFDVVVLRNAISASAPAERAAMMSEVMRVVRPGGRCIAIEDMPRGGWWAAVTGQGSGGSRTAGPAAVEQLTAGGFRGVRLLAEREGIAFVEGLKAAHHVD